MGASHGLPPAFGRTWLRTHRSAAVAGSVGLYAAVFIVHRVMGDGGTSAATLYVLPVTLVAIACGFPAGVIAAAVGLALSGLEHVTGSGAQLTALAWSSRALVLFGFGALVGSTSDRVDELVRNLAEAQRMRLRVAEHAQRQQHALEINDTIIQNLLLAKWSLSAGQVDEAATLLDATILIGQELVSAMLPEEIAAGALRRSTPASSESG